MKMVTSKSCQVCVAAPHKYKCPKCCLKYCSVPCYKKHKALSCKSPSKDEESNRKKVPAESQAPFTIDTTRLVPFPSDDGVTASTVLPEKLQLLRRDEEISNCLQNVHLRNLLRHLNDAEDPAKALQAAMMEPLFVQLADHCLRVVDGNEDKRMPSGP